MTGERELRAINVDMVDEVTGQRREIFMSDSYLPENPAFEREPWEAGDLSCDCNRFRLFYGSTTFGDVVPADIPCGAKRFRVASIRLDGDVVYEEREGDERRAPEPHPRH